MTGHGGFDWTHDTKRRDLAFTPLRLTVLAGFFAIVFVIIWWLVRGDYLPAWSYGVAGVVALAQLLRPFWNRPHAVVSRLFLNDDMLGILDRRSVRPNEVRVLMLADLESAHALPPIVHFRLKDGTGDATRCRAAGRVAAEIQRRMAKAHARAEHKA